MMSPVRLSNVLIVTRCLLPLGLSFFANMAAFGVMVTERILGEKVTNFFRHRNEENSLTLGSIVNANPNIHLANKP